MSEDLRLGYGGGMRRMAAEAFAEGRGYRAAAKRLGPPPTTVRKWHRTYVALGIEGLLVMGEKSRSYRWELKVAAAKAVAEGRRPKADVMARYGIASLSPLEKWCKAYREGGAEALGPKPKGRPRRPPSPPKPAAREQELERRIRKLEAENAYLKKIDSPEGGEALSNREKAAAASELSGRYPLVDLLEAAGLSRSSCHYSPRRPKAPTRPELWEAVGEIFSRAANGCGHRQIAMRLRAERGAVIADKTVPKMMREMGISCGIRREAGCRRHSSYRGAVGETFENVIGRDFDADGPWQKLGTDVAEFKQPWGKAYFAPVCDFGSKEIVAWSTSPSPGLSQQRELLDRLLDRLPEGARPVLHSDMGWQYRHATWCRRLREAGIVQGMSRKGNCLDNGATEQVFGHIKDEFFRGVEWPGFDEFKRDLDAYIVHWNTRRRQVKLKGLTPEEFRNQSLAA